MKGCGKAEGHFHENIEILSSEILGWDFLQEQVHHGEGKFFLAHILKDNGILVWSTRSEEISSDLMINIDDMIAMTPQETANLKFSSEVTEQV